MRKICFEEASPSECIQLWFADVAALRWLLKPHDLFRIVIKIYMQLRIWCHKSRCEVKYSSYKKTIAKCGKMFFKTVINYESDRLLENSQCNVLAFCVQENNHARVYSTEPLEEVKRS